jgi:hypothetical protein
MCDYHRQATKFKVWGIGEAATWAQIRRSVVTERDGETWRLQKAYTRATPSVPTNAFVLHVEPTHAGINEADLGTGISEDLARSMKSGLLMLIGDILTDYGAGTDIMLETGITSNILERPFIATGSHEHLQGRPYFSKKLAPFQPPAEPGEDKGTRTDWNVVR